MSQREDCVALQLEAIELSWAAGGSSYCDPLHELCTVEKRTARESPVPPQLYGLCFKAPKFEAGRS